MLPPFKPLTKEKADEMAALSLQEGFRASDALDFGRQLQKKPRKRPVTKRQVAVSALELRLSDTTKWTWNRLAQKFCTCGAPHEFRCQDNLRREVRHLQSLLRKYSIAVP